MLRGQFVGGRIVKTPESVPNITAEALNPLLDTQGNILQTTGLSSRSRKKVIYIFSRGTVTASGNSKETNPQQKLDISFWILKVEGTS
jgi:hypothetical protein